MEFTYDISNDRFFVKKSRTSPRNHHFLDEYEYVRYLPEDDVSKEIIKEFLARVPNEICFEITDKCNFSCPVCIANAGIKNNIFLHSAVVKKIINRLPKHVQRVTITGGETTLHPDIAEIINYSTEKVATVLSTNGFYPDQLDAITRKNKKNLIIAISLHGPKDIHDNFVGKNGAFEKAVKSIKLSIRNGTLTHIYTTASESNIATLSELAEILTGLDIIEHRINLIKPNGRINVRPASWADVYGAISKQKVYHRTTIKKEGQPFLFVSCRGVMEIKNV